MSRLVATLAAAALLLCSMSVLLCSNARAATGANGLAGSADEMAGWVAITDEKWVRAREIGDKILRTDPDSFAGHYILGMAMHYGEGDLARAVWHLEQAASLFEAKYGPRPGNDAPWRWHWMTLVELAQTLNEMDRPREELEVLDRFDAAYKPKRIAQRVWPLMKLRRYDEARKAAAEVLHHENDDPDAAFVARSDLCAAECEAGDRDAAYTACTDALKPFHDLTFGGMIEFSNASEAALSVFKFDAAERFLAESAKRADTRSWGNPYQHLAQLYLGEIRIPEAIDALKEGQDLRMSRPAYLDQHGQARLDLTVASLLLVVGETERGLQIAERAEARPDRQGVHSGTEAQADAAAAILVALARREHAERLAEDAVTSGFLDGAKARARAAEARALAWEAERAAATYFADEDFLVRTIRPYYVGGADLPMWILPEIVRYVGAGVAQAAVAKAREVDHYGASASYFDAFDAEADFQQGRWRDALDVAERALAKLPRAEALMLARLEAIAGVAAEHLGDAAREEAHLGAAMTRDPGVMRRLGVALPVRISSDGSDVARMAATMIASSPRFASRDDAPFTIELDGPRATACLDGPKHARIACANVHAEGLTAKETARRLVKELHRVGFAIKSDLSQADLTTLDGSPTAARADKQVKGLLDKWGPDGVGLGHE